MSSNIIKLLLGICVFLLLILFIEFEVLSLSNNEKGKALNTEKHQDQLIKLPRIILSKKAMEGYPEMVESPLFLKDRKPVIDMEDGPVEVLGLIEDWVLVGIYSTKDRLVALLSQSKGDKKFIKKLEGDDVAGFLLKEIKADRVILERDGKEQPLMLRKARPRPKIKPKANRKIKKKPILPLKNKTKKPKS